VRITFVIYDIKTGGAERMLCALANFFVTLPSYSVTVVLSAPSGQEPTYALDSRINVVLNKGAHKLLRAINLRKAIIQTTPDLVISFVDITNIITLLTLMGTRIPVIVAERIDPTFHPLAWIYQWLRFKTYPHAKAITVQTTSAADYFPPVLKQKIHVISNPVLSPPTHKTAYTPQATTLVSSGRLDTQKDHTTLIKAFALISQKYPELTLTIYGEGPLRSELENLIRFLKLEGRVFLPGFDKDIYKALAQADIFVFPSLYEGFPNALCEAMAVGLPVVASNCSGTVDLIQESHNGRLFPVGDHTALAAILEALIPNQKHRQDLGQNAQKICEIYSPERVFKIWKDLVEDVIR